MTRRDFTFEVYRRLCRNIIDSGYEVHTVEKYLQAQPESGFVILRHDVDSRPKKALLMAEMECEMDINSTYYFRFTKGLFVPDIIERIRSLGHEVGYHYEVLSKTRGNFEDAIKLFKYELAQFNKICKISTICMHGSVLSAHDNRELWNLYDFRDFNIAGEAYLSVGEGLNYFSDTGWEWSERHKMRDILSSNEGCANVSTTDDLQDVILNNRLKNIYLLVHPGNWAFSAPDWCQILIKNKIFNLGKGLLRSVNYYENHKQH